MSLLPTLIQELTMKNEMLHAENALKLTQILDLEIILYNTHMFEDGDGSPCWCCVNEVLYPHDDYCVKARHMTEHFWKK